MRLTLALAYAFSVASVVADEPDEIPLKSVHALDMPGTRDVRKLDDQGRVEALRKTLERPTARPAASFIVQGRPEDALRQFYRIRVGGEKPAKLSTTDDVWVAFFSYQLGVYVHLDKVERSGARVTVRWRPVYHDEQQLTNHLALIPLGKLPAGEYEVQIVQAPPLDSQRDFFQKTSDLTKYVSRSFKFVISAEE